MAKIFSVGGAKLHGSISVSGSKNAALPIIAATLLTDHTITLSNTPDLCDVRDMLQLISCHFKDVTFDRNILTVKSSDKKDFYQPNSDDAYSRIRASCLLLGPLLAKKKRAQIIMPGGCAIGARPIDLHIHALQKMGAEFKFCDHLVKAKTDLLKGALIEFPKKSVGATQNTMMAATLAHGRTVIKNASQEPEVVDLANFLVSMGAQINGIGSETVVVDGVEKLHSSNYNIIPDRIEAGTYLIMLAATGGGIKLRNVRCDHLDSVINALRKTRSLKIICKGDSILAEKICRANPVDIVTEPYPGFPTDLQAQFTALMCLSQGRSTITENIFEDRFAHAQELLRMGAKINITGNKINITGVQSISGSPLVIKDLRGGAGLLIASLAAEGDSVLQNAKCLNRGYEDIVYKISRCGGQVFKQESSECAQKPLSVRFA